MTTNAALKVAAWQRQNLELLNCCPVCGSTSADKMYEGLRDLLFSAAGNWTLWRCSDCQSAFLNPRPTADSIVYAYKNYFTHESGDVSDNAYKSLFDFFKHGLRNSYINHRLGHKLQPFIPGGWLAVASATTLTRRALHYVRHLSRPAAGENRLLDVGCGNGNFLAVAQDLGYEAHGLDMDPHAIEIARACGFDVAQGMVPGSRLTPNSFDRVTLRHVIEHLHDPIGALHEIFSLLKTGGWIWVHTPNIESNGHRRFGSAWRGLEPPRHLVLFNRQSLLKAMTAAGFNQIKLLPPSTEAQFCFYQSATTLDAMNFGGSEYRQTRFFRREVRRAEWRASKYPETAESITMVGQK